MFKKVSSRSLLWTLVIWFVVPLPLIISALLNYPADQANSKIFVVFGLIAYSAMLSTIVLGSKPKFLDKRIGLPQVYQVHMFSAIFILITMNLHKVGLKASGLVGFFGEMASVIFSLVIVFSAIYFTRMLTRLFPPIQKVKDFAEEHLKHEVVIWGHRFTLIGTLAVFIHASLIDYIRAIPYFYPLFVLYTLITFIIFGLYVKDFYFKPTNAKLLNKLSLDTDIHQFTLQMNGDLDYYQPGQFVYLSFPSLNGLKEAHPFSIVEVDKDQKQMTLAVLENGDFTQLLPSVPDNEPATISKAFGLLPDLIQQADPDRPLVILIGGIGITPFVSLLKQVPGEAHVYYSVKADKDILFRDQLKEWQAQPNLHLTQQQKRLDLDQVKQDLVNLDQGQFIIAGPPAMNDSFNKQLIEMGVPKDQIFCENFSW